MKRAANAEPAYRNRQRELVLVARAQRGDAKAAEELLKMHGGLLVNTVRAYAAIVGIRERSEIFKDLLNEAKNGLLEAVPRFEAEKGRRLTTYAIWWIRKRILNVLRTRTTIRLPQYQLKKIRGLRKAESDLFQEFGRDPSIEEIASRVGVSSEEVVELFETFLAQKEMSLDSNDPENDRDPLVSFIGNQTSPNPEQEFIRKDLAEKLHNALRELTEIERSIMIWRFAMNGDDKEATLKEIGKKLGLSRERVRQIERDTKEKLRHAISKRKHR